MPQEPFRYRNGRRAGPKRANEDLTDRDRRQQGGVATRRDETVEQVLGITARRFPASEVGEDDRCIDQHRRSRGQALRHSPLTTSHRRSQLRRSSVR